MARPAKRARQSQPAVTQSINTFGRVSKANLPQTPTKKAPVSSTEPASSKKRKASCIEVEEPHRKLTPRTVSFLPSSDDEADGCPRQSKRPCQRQQAALLATAPAKSSPSKAVKGKRVAKALPSRTQTAHGPTESTLISKSRQSTKKSIQTKIDASFRKSRKTQADNGFPPHLQDLVDLHRAFVKTVMLQMAHNGAHVPVDVRDLAPNMARAWRKRQATVEDIRRCIAIQAASDETSSPFIVTDYGRGKVCIELDPRHTGVSVDQDKLCKQFEANLRHLCSQRATEDEDKMTDIDIPLGGLSLDELPQVAITNMDLSAVANPLLAKGQRALNELKKDMAAKQQQTEEKQHAASNPMLNRDGTKMSLLDRIRFKQLAKENAPLPPSGPELERRAALNRVADVSATISMLSLSKPPSLPRQAFTMQAILERLKDSLRMPISNDEASNCVRLIASEVAPEWLRVVTIGGRENVVVQRNRQPVDRVIRERVEKLMA
ncbi:hypothetical protein ACRE_032910 [Hapsidospora chrysogenum ATCC 11550]|uniref:DNA replication factor Cdt1 C-terminal domain-containing protein n=1 Tax=Hapsidospora chrysogenum (strain ATCC 11550 / CBS 779.69 / DSM 880 / IAM 14645 / JCM 23072 / IMI 49137) TaxID=857340 RepID=A0A086T919_HAPC1|nr:hypothetical protein ACRE_032910 [Hapsidospora chrysogenum ATCC 11550]